MILIALALAAQPVTVQLSEEQARAVMCRGPVAVIADDDPGLALYRDEIAEWGIEEAKVELAFNRGETCDDSERGGWDEGLSAPCASPAASVPPARGVAVVYQPVGVVHHVRPASLAVLGGKGVEKLNHLPHGVSSDPLSAASVAPSHR